MTENEPMAELLAHSRELAEDAGWRPVDASDDAESTVAHPRAPAADPLAPETGAFLLRDWAWGPLVWQDGREEAVFPVGRYGPHRDVRVWLAGDGRRAVYDRFRGQYAPVAVWPAPPADDAAGAEALRLHVITYALHQADRLDRA